MARTLRGFKNIQDMTDVELLNFIEINRKLSIRRIEALQELEKRESKKVELVTA